MRTNDQIIEQILNKRGIVAEDEICEFLSQKPTRTYDPFLLDGMRAGVDLLLSVVDGEGAENKRICIYGDYDADGVTAATVMAYAVSSLTDNWFFYVPSRFREGYGLNVNALDRIRDAGTELIITVDCGCVSKYEVEYAKSIGLKVIVTDHHNIEDVIADCIVIDPKKTEPFLPEGVKPYPCADLAGCGVAFKFLQALQRTANLPKSILSDALDMVAVGTVGDIVPLRDENRTLVKYGIDMANSGRRPALTRLAKAISIDRITSENIAYGIVPHINATGRMDTAMEAIGLFNAGEDDFDETTGKSIIEEKIEKLIYCNSERKRIQKNAYESCVSMVSGNEDFIVLDMPDMHEGIAGIVAGEIKDRFSRPVIIVTPSEGEGGDDGTKYLKGTGRSIPKIDLYEILNKHSELFKRFGGHKGACGFLMNESYLKELTAGVNSEVKKLLDRDPKLFEKEIYVDTGLEPAEVSVELSKELLKIAPFGEGNPNPRFIMSDVVIHSLSYMGENRTHARFSVCNGKKSNNGTDTTHRLAYVNCVLFRNAQHMKDMLECGKPVDLTGSLSYQVWRGQERVQFIVEDIKLCKLEKPDLS